MVHAFTCAGILPSQYVHFIAHADLDTLGPWYMSSGISQYTDLYWTTGGFSVNCLVVYNKVNQWTPVAIKLSTMKATAEVKAMPEYAASGEVRTYIMDA